MLNEQIECTLNEITYYLFDENSVLIAFTATAHVHTLQREWHKGWRYAGNVVCVFVCVCVRVFYVPPVKKWSGSSKGSVCIKHTLDTFLGDSGEFFERKMNAYEKTHLRIKYFQYLIERIFTFFSNNV